MTDRHAAENGAAATRPDLRAANAALDAEIREGKAHGLMTDAFMEAVRIRFGSYSTGLEERECTKRIENAIRDYFRAKMSPSAAIAFTAPDRMAQLVEAMTVAQTIEPQGEAATGEQG